MKRLQHGILIALEGFDGSGKSTLAKNLCARLQAEGLPVLLTYEPGDTPVGTEIRKILQDNRKTMVPKTEFLLYSADRAQHIADVVRPALERGMIVISDRMADSSRAYQGYGRGLDLKEIEAVTAWAMNGIKPDLTFYLALDVQTALERIYARKEELTRIESEKRAFFEAVINGFEKIFAGRSDVVRLDAREDRDAVAHRAFDAVIGCIKSGANGES